MNWEPIIRRREALGLNQAQLAKRMKTSEVQVSRLETSKRKMTIDWLRKFAAALECKPSDLLDDEDVADRLSQPERALLKILQEQLDYDPHEILELVVELRGLVRQEASRRLMRGQLGGDPLLVAQMANVWTDLTDTERASAVDLIRTASNFKTKVAA